MRRRRQRAIQPLGRAEGVGRARPRRAPLSEGSVVNQAMAQATTARHLTVRNADVSLGGTLWLPVDHGGTTVLMHPGSGPSDRDNDVFFPPIRQYLLECGITVSSFDKRGVGDSTGRWQEAAIEEQASDAIACLEALRADASSNGRVGLYGHSQGGWASSRLRLVVHGRRLSSRARGPESRPPLRSGGRRARTWLARISRKRRSKRSSVTTTASSR